MPVHILQSLLHFGSQQLKSDRIAEFKEKIMATTSTTITTERNTLFPYILYGLLNDIEEILTSSSSSKPISWNIDGTSFKIVQPSLLLGALQTYFGIPSLDVFFVRLQQWGFKLESLYRISHPYFLRGNPVLLCAIKQITTTTLLADIRNSNDIANRLQFDLRLNQNIPPRDNNNNANEISSRGVVASCDEASTFTRKSGHQKVHDRAKLKRKRSNSPSSISPPAVASASSSPRTASNKVIKTIKTTPSSPLTDKVELNKTIDFVRYIKDNPYNSSKFIVNSTHHSNCTKGLLFPWTLHDIICEESQQQQQQDGPSPAMSWQSDGRSFIVSNESVLIKDIFPKKFGNEFPTWEAFTKELSSWGFVRFTDGSQKGAFVHRLFCRGNQTQFQKMRVHGKTVAESPNPPGDFLVRLHLLLTRDEDKFQDIVNWDDDGKGFTVLDVIRFVQKVLPMYFSSMTFPVFERKLRCWGFSRSPPTAAPTQQDSMQYHFSHHNFHRDVPPSFEYVDAKELSLHELQPEHNFLTRLRAVLTDCQQRGLKHVLSWCSHGRAFCIHDREYLVHYLLPQYFNTKFSNFRLALRNWGFCQFANPNSWDNGAYYHKLFVIDQPELYENLLQVQMKSIMPEWVPNDKEPDYYNYKERDPPKQEIMEE